MKNWEKVQERSVVYQDGCLHTLKRHVQIIAGKEMPVPSVQLPYHVPHFKKAAQAAHQSNPKFMRTTS